MVLDPYRKSKACAKSSSRECLRAKKHQKDRMGRANGGQSSGLMTYCRARVSLCPEPTFRGGGGSAPRGGHRPGHNRGPVHAAPVGQGSQRDASSFRQTLPVAIRPGAEPTRPGGMAFAKLGWQPGN